MIEGIDIFAPRDSGLPDLSKISAAQIFNGSSLASLQAMKEQYDPYGLLKVKGFDGVAESTQKNTTIDPLTGKRVEVRRASVVAELLDGKSAKDRGHRKVSPSSSSSDYSAPASPFEQPDLPENPSPTDNILLPEQAPPDMESGPSSALLPPELLDTPKTSWLRKLPTTVLEEIRNLYRV